MKNKIISKLPIFTAAFTMLFSVVVFARSEAGVKTGEMEADQVTTVYIKSGGEYDLSKMIKSEYDKLEIQTRDTVTLNVDGDFTFDSIWISPGGDYDDNSIIIKGKGDKSKITVRGIRGSYQLLGKVTIMDTEAIIAGNAYNPVVDVKELNIVNSTVTVRSDFESKKEPVAIMTNKMSVEGDDTVVTAESEYDAIVLCEPDPGKPVLSDTLEISYPKDTVFKKVWFEKKNCYLYLAYDGDIMATKVEIKSNGTGRENISKAEITVPEQTYTGSVLTPVPEVRLNDALLVYGTDFEVSYENNINAGTAKMTVTGIGKYQGTADKEFTIGKAPQVITVPTEVKKNRSDKKFTLDYKQTGDGELVFNTANAGIVEVDDKGNVTINGPGTTTITIYAYETDNYLSAEKKINVTIVNDNPNNPDNPENPDDPDNPDNPEDIDNKKQDISTAAISGIKNKTYTGKKLKQSPTVILGDKTLTEGTDYTISYSNNKNVGTATMTFTGSGAYKGTVQKTFKIKKAATKITGRTLNVKASALKKKDKKYSVSKVIKITKTKGKKTFKKIKGNKNITINKKTGKVTIKKGLKKGKYKVRVKVTVKGDKNHKKKTKTVTFTVKVK